MDLPNRRTLLQLGVSGAGVLVLFMTVSSALSLGPSRGDGFVNGLAYFFLYLLGGAGFVLLTGGLAVPVNEGQGIKFSVNQRRLLIASLGLGLGSFIAPLIFWFVAASLGISPGLVMGIWMFMVLGAVASLFAAISWRSIQIIREKWF